MLRRQDLSASRRKSTWRRLNNVPFNNDQDSVAYANEAYREMRDDYWTKLHDLLDGTKAMRAAKETHLPREENEPKKSYEKRLERSVLNPAFAESIERMVAKPFSKPVSVTAKDDRIPEWITDLEEDVDGTGVSLTDFSGECFTDMRVYGKTHIIVDHDPIPEGSSLADVQRLGLRVRLIRIPPPYLIGWKGNERNLRQVRVYEPTEVENGAFGVATANRIRVYEPDRWQLWEQGGKEQEWTMIDEGPNGLGVVPLVTIYANRVDTFVSIPPHLRLADINIAHWQSESDQRNILHWARVPLLFAAGFTEDEARDVVVSVGSLIRTGNKEARMEYVEHSGQAIDAGYRDLERLETQMRAIGLQPMMRQTGDIKATQVAVDESQNQSEIQQDVVRFESGLWEVFEMAGRWLDAELPDEFGVNVFSDFAVSLRGTEDMNLLTTMFSAGAIDHLTYLQEMQRRGLLSENITPQQIIERTENEGRDLTFSPMQGAPGGGFGAGGFGGSPPAGSPADDNAA